MPYDHEVNKKIEDALQGLDGSHRAQPKPYLLTRINARMQQQADSVWDKTARFITRPVVAFAGLCSIVAINFFIVTSNSHITTAKEQRGGDSYATSIASLYYNETTEP